QPAPEIYFSFRGRLVSSFVLPHLGVSPMPFLPQDKESFFEKHRMQKKRFSFLKKFTYVSYAKFVHCSLFKLNTLVMSPASFDKDYFKISCKTSKNPG